MLISREPDPSSGDEGQSADDAAGVTEAAPERAPMRSIQMFELPEDAEAQPMADQRPADRPGVRERQADPGAPAVRGSARVRSEPARGSARVHAEPPQARGSAKVQPEPAPAAQTPAVQTPAAQTPAVQTPAAQPETSTAPARGSARVQPEPAAPGPARASASVPPPAPAAPPRAPQRPPVTPPRTQQHPPATPPHGRQRSSVAPQSPAVVPHPDMAQHIAGMLEEKAAARRQQEAASGARGSARVQPATAPPTASPAPDATARIVPPAPVRQDPSASETALIETGPSRGSARVPMKTMGRVSAEATSLLTPTVAPPPPVVEPFQIPIVPGRPGARRPKRPEPEDPSRAPKPARWRRQPLDLGSAPWVLGISSLGVLLVAFAYAGGRDQTGGAIGLYWIGQIVVFVPVVLRLLSRRMAGTAESFLLVMGLAVNQYALKWMYSPDQLRFPDELQHWLATTVLQQSGKLFQPNLALPPAVHFPGLAEMAAATSSMTGLTVTASGVIVAGVAHLVFVGMIFVTTLRASRSPAVAGVACALYATALHYLFFDSMFLYQTVALPFFMLTIWANRRWLAGSGWPFALLAIVSVMITTVSHHVTAIALVGTLFLLAITELVLARPRRKRVFVLPVVALVVLLAWVLLVARDVLAYLEEPITTVIDTVHVMIAGGQTTASSTTAAIPIGQLALQGAGLIGLFVLYSAAVRDMVHRHDRDAWRWAAVAGTLIFFGGNAVRFLGQNGPEISSRLQTFTYIPVGILVAIALVRGVQIIPLKDAEGHRWRAAAPAFDYPAEGGWHLWSRVAAGSALITLLMVGGRAGGWPPLGSVLPGPYLPGGFERSVDAYGVDAADWEKNVLGPGNRVGGDITAVSLASTYGRQDPVREVGSLFYATSWGLAQDNMVNSLALQYLVVDKRMGDQLPESDAYFEDDPEAGNLTSPLSRTQLGKFDTLADVDRLYDNGNVRIYRMAQQ